MTQHRLLGWTIRTLQELRRAGRGLSEPVRAGRRGVFPDETVELTWEVLSRQELTDVWDVAQSNQQDRRRPTSRGWWPSTLTRPFHEYPPVQATEMQYAGVGPVIAAATELERVTRTAPFGFRLWDPVARRAVTDGLGVKAPIARAAAARRTGPQQRVLDPGPALAMPFVAGPGMTRSGPTSRSSGPGGEIRVTDPGGRYLPFRFRADGALRIGPAPARCAGSRRALESRRPGGRCPTCRSSCPRRPCARVRRQRDHGPAPTRRPRPGRHARRGGGPGRADRLGLADRRGSVPIDLPYPPAPGPAGDPATPPRLAMSALRWTGVRIRAMRDLDLADPAYPDLCAVLSQADNPDLPILARSEPPSGPLGPQTHAVRATARPADGGPPRAVDRPGA